MSARRARGGAGHTATESMNNQRPHSTCGHFDSTALPSPRAFMKAHGRRLTGGGEWRTTRCTLCEAEDALLRRTSGAFRCKSCGARGRDALDVYRLETGVSFKTAARRLGAWKEVSP